MLTTSTDSPSSVDSAILTQQKWLRIMHSTKKVYACLATAAPSVLFVKATQ